MITLWARLMRRPNRQTMKEVGVDTQGTAHQPAKSADNRTEPEPRREPGWFKMIDRVSLVFALAGGAACALMAFNIILDVIGRSFFNQPLPGTLDMTQFVWMPTLVALGFGFALLRGEHIRVSLLTGGASPRVKRVIELISMVAIFVVSLVLAYYTVDKAVDAMGFDERAVGTSWVLIWPFRWVVVAGLLALALQSVVEFFRARRVVPESTLLDDLVEADL